MGGTEESLWGKVYVFKEIVKGWTKHIDFMILDILCLEISFLIAYGMRNGFTDIFSMPRMYENMFLALIVLDICVVFFFNSYECIIKRGYLAEIRQVLIHNLWIVVGFIVGLFLVQQTSQYSRAIVLTMYPISVCLMLAARLAWKRVIRVERKRKKDLRNVFVITTSQRASSVIRDLMVPYRDYMIAGIALYDQNVKRGERKIRNIPVCAGKDDAIEYIQNHVVDEVFIDIRDNDNEIIILMNLLVNMGLTVHVNLLPNNYSLNNKKVQSFGNCTVLSATMKFASPRQIFVKRVMDICGGLVGLILTGIAYIIFAPIIKKQSPGPIFFSQERVGRNGRTFKIYKFRTMYPDAEERKKELMAQNKMNGLMFKMDNDPRIFPIGHFLREKSIDELPQFWNVLKGDMSLVGTRPPTMDEYVRYEAHHRKRLAMKPGLTGLWQATGRSDITDFEEVVALDAQYIQEWSVWMDIKIIWMTVLVVLKGEGAV